MRYLDGSVSEVPPLQLCQRKIRAHQSTSKETPNVRLSREIPIPVQCIRAVRCYAINNILNLATLHRETHLASGGIGEAWWETGACHHCTTLTAIAGAVFCPSLPRSLCLLHEPPLTTAFTTSPCPNYSHICCYHAPNGAKYQYTVAGSHKDRRHAR